MPSGGDLRVELWLVDLEGLSPLLEREEQAAPRLAADEMTRAAAITSEGGARRHWRASHIALRILIERWAGPALRGQPFAIGLGGRPELDGHPVSFSLSHTGSVALIALSRHGPIGADVERIRPIRLSADRRAAIIAHAEGLVPQAAIAGPEDARFLQAWVRLEAAAKAGGDGMAPMLSDAGIFGRKRGQRAGGSDAPGSSSAAFAVRDVTAGAGLFAAVAAPELPPEVNMLLFPADETGLSGLMRPRGP